MDDNIGVRLTLLRRQNRASFVENLDDYRRIADHGSDGSERDDGLIRAALHSLIGDVLSVGADAYVNAGN